MAKMKDFDPVCLSEKVVERTKNNDFKQMVLQNGNNGFAVKDSKKSIRASVERSFKR